ncbi:MAG TPA: helix-turn-helix domain-containing protein [Phototrophicaceae bacterium]|nr:helix-turn-helix domain-containing protein [Phototrophicaceae bacterium]
MDDNLILVDHRPSRADAIKNRELLLQTAQRLFDLKGVDAVTMSDVAEAAGVGKGTLYRHFSNKNDLCQVLIDQDQRDLQERTLARLREQGDPLADLEWFLREVVAFVSRNQAVVFAMAALGTQLDHPAHLWWRQTIRGLLLRLKPQVDVEYTTDMLFVMLDPRTIHYQLSGRGYSFERIADALVAILDRLVA